MARNKNAGDLVLREGESFNLSEARFRTIFDTAAVGIGMMSLDRKLIDANPAFCRMFGMAREELIGRTPAIITYPEDFSQSTQQFHDLLSGRQDYFWGERRYVRKNGEVFWVHVTMSIVRSPDGQPLYLVGLLVDIDAQKKASAELQQSEMRFRTVFETTSVGIALVGLDGVPLAVNPAILKMTGYTESDLLKMNNLELTHPGDRPAAFKQMRELVIGQRDAIQVECRFIRKNGEVHWVRQGISPVPGPDGKPAYFVVMAADINEQKRTHIELEESERRFRALFENVSIGMTMVSLDRRILAVNKTTERIIGCTAGELVGTSPADLSHPEDLLIGLEGFNDLVAGQRESLLMEKRYVRKNGEVFWARITYLLVRSPDGQPQLLVGSIEDINEQKMAAEKLRAQENEYLRTLEQRVDERTRELKEANLRLVAEIKQRQQVEETLASKAAEEAILAERTRLAHDLHDAVTQTLFSASLIAEVLPDMWSIDQDEARKSTDELRQLTRGALAEMRTLLLELRPAALTQTRFPDLLRQLSEAVIGRARLPVNLDVTGDYEMPPEVKVAFYRVAQESLNNIVKYARATLIEIRLKQECCNVHLQIRDNGIGFDSASIKPTSLGMRIMRERADAIHAKFRVTSRSGQGTTVSLDWNEDELLPISKIHTRVEI
jgi:PAS domain S-box-containing protein